VIKFKKNNVGRTANIIYIYDIKVHSSRQTTIMKKISKLLFSQTSRLFMIAAYLICVVPLSMDMGCTPVKNTTATIPPIQRIPAKFDFSPPSRSQVGVTNITIAIVKPTYIGKNPEYYIAPFNEMAVSMGNDFEELLTAKGFTMRGPFGSRDEMVYNDKVNSSFVLEIGIELNPQYNTKYHTSTKTNWGALLNKNASASISSISTSGEITISGNLVINAKSAQYGELIWKKNIALQPSSFTYDGSISWATNPTIAEEINKDNQVYNTLSSELQNFYMKSLNLAWQQIDPLEMKSVAEQAKKADKKGS
jgi:hypothetical protein